MFSRDSPTAVLYYRPHSFIATLTKIYMLIFGKDEWYKNVDAQPHTLPDIV